MGWFLVTIHTSTPKENISLQYYSVCIEFQILLGSIRHMYKVNMYNPAKTT